MVLAPPRTDPRLDALVAAMVNCVQPELILLFGSRAWGTPHEDSDYDIILVLRDDADVERARDVAYDATEAMDISADILACTVGQYEHRQKDPGFVEWLVSREGRLLYARGTQAQRASRADRVSERPTEGRDIWIERAEGDFQEATVSLASATPTWAAICFHAHACIEKLLKALIVDGGTYPPRTHNLMKLLSRLPATLRDNAELRAIAKRLNKMYPKSRYVPHPLPTAEEARAAFDAARRGRDMLLQQLE
jgi:HEPN domain-containing protein/predicted nucleotidyltransferase